MRSPHDKARSVDRPGILATDVRTDGYIGQVLYTDLSTGWFAVKELGVERAVWWRELRIDEYAALRYCLQWRRTLVWKAKSDEKLTNTSSPLLPLLPPSSFTFIHSN